jgi:hypothetical protein
MVRVQRYVEWTYGYLCNVWDRDQERDEKKRQRGAYTER